MEEKNLNKVIEEKNEIRKLKDEEELIDKLIQKFCQKNHNINEVSYF